MLMRTDPFREWSPFSAFDAARDVGVAMDAYRVGDVITLNFDLPGADPDSINVEIERGELRLSARRTLHAPDGAQYLVRERADTQVHRRVMLGDVLDVEHVDAEFADGVLTLRIPLHETAKPRQIDVRHASGDEDRSIAVESG